jgi:hypothetical protein
MIGDGYVAVAMGVNASAAGGFRVGNIVFEVLIREPVIVNQDSEAPKATTGQRTI